MTLGQRIQELRKQKGLSQEKLGEALGVSRQAVSKWEGDNGIPELDTLIAMSRLFEVTVGQLLGIEEPQAHPEEEPAGKADEDRIESILRQYAEESSSRKPEGSWFARWGWAVSAAIVVAAVVIVLFAQISSLRSTVRLLRGDVSSLQMQVSNNQDSLSQQIRGTIYDVLAEEAALLNTFNWEMAAFDLDNQTATIRLKATMKEYGAGNKLQFSANWCKTDDTEGVTTSDWVEGPDFTAEMTLPLNYSTKISIRVEDMDGNIQEQYIDEIYHLHPDNFRLSAYNLTTPFAITVHSFGVTYSTARAEQAYIDIQSIYPKLFWPEEAVITAQVNGEEIFTEEMTVSPASNDATTFRASIKDYYHDLTLKDGDILEVLLLVTDNLGRTEQFVDCVTIVDGWPEHSEAAAPVISVG